VVGRRVKEMRRIAKVRRVVREVVDRVVEEGDMLVCVCVGAG
jgi:predicted PP-loop superfamily ATPase